MAPQQPIDSLQPLKTTQARTPEEEANRLYSEGLDDCRRASDLEKQAASESDARKQEKLRTKIRGRYLDAVKKFSAATAKDPRHFSAWGNLGHAYLKTGNAAAALDACGKALTIQTNYSAAMECRGEALLGLNRLDDVKAAYESLARLDPTRADELAAAIDRWLAKKKSDPAGVDPARLDDLAQWAARLKPAGA